MIVVISSSKCYWGGLRTRESIYMTLYMRERAFNRVYKSFSFPELQRTDIYIKQITPYIKALIEQQVVKLVWPKYGCLYMPIHVGRMEEVRRTSHSSGFKGARYVTSVSFVIVGFNLLSSKLDSFTSKLPYWVILHWCCIYTKYIAILSLFLAKNPKWFISLLQNLKNCCIYCSI